MEHDSLENIVIQKQFIPEITLILARQWCQYFTNIFGQYHLQFRELYHARSGPAWVHVRNSIYTRLHDDQNEHLESLYCESKKFWMRMERLGEYIRTERGINTSITADFFKYPFPKRMDYIHFWRQTPPEKAHEFQDLCTEFLGWILYYESWKQYLCIQGFSYVTDFHCVLRNQLAKRLIKPVPHLPVEDKKIDDACFVRKPTLIAVRQLHQFFGEIFEMNYEKLYNLHYHVRTINDDSFNIQKYFSYYGHIKTAGYHFKNSFLTFDAQAFMEKNVLGRGGKAYNLHASYNTDVWAFQKLYKVCFEFLGWILNYENCFGETTNDCKILKTALRNMLGSLEEYQLKKKNN